MDEQNTTTGLKRNANLATAIAVVVGCVIGAGVFFKPYAIYQATGGAPGMGMLAWLLGGLMSILGALTFAEVAVMIPETGGMVAYLSRAFGERAGFLAGWMQVILFYPAFLAGYGVKVGEELSAIFGVNVQTGVGIVVILALALVNMRGSGEAGGLQKVSTVCKLIPLVVLIIFGFLWGKSGASVTTPVVGEGVSVTGALGSTLLAVLFAFEGWTNVGALAGEMERPERDLPRAIVGGVGIIMGVYLLINVAYLRVIPASELMNLSSPASAVAERLFGSAGGLIIQVGIIISVVGAGNGFLLSGSRVAYYLAQKGTLPASDRLAKLNAGQVPAGSILLIAVLACLYSLTGSFDLLTDLGVFSCWVFYTLTFATVIRFRRTQPDAPRSYRVPGYPVVPVVAIASGLFVIASQLFLSGADARMMSVFSILVTLAGLPVYLLVQRCARAGGAHKSKKW